MPRSSASPDQLDLPLGAGVALPPNPDTASLRSGIDTRIAAITTAALPRLRAQRAFLEGLSASDRAGGVLLFADPRHPIRCAPAGADLLATVLAEEAALLREEVALRDLRDALELYQAGGRLTVQELDDSPGDVPPAATATASPAHAGSPAAGAVHTRGRRPCRTVTAGGRRRAGRAGDGASARRSG